jgi:hypothetical protein
VALREAPGCMSGSNDASIVAITSPCSPPVRV